jgi:hypothetical protein
VLVNNAVAVVHKKTVIQFVDRNKDVSTVTKYQSDVSAISPQLRLGCVIVGLAIGDLVAIDLSEPEPSHSTAVTSKFGDFDDLSTFCSKSSVLHSFDIPITSLICYDENIIGILSSGDMFLFTHNGQVREVQISGHIVSRFLKPTCCYLCISSIAKSRLREFIESSGPTSTCDIILVGVSDGSVRYILIDRSTIHDTFHDDEPCVISLNSIPYSLNRRPIVSIFITSPMLRSDTIVSSPSMPSSISQFQICGVHSDASMSIYTHFNNSTSSLKGTLVHLPVDTDCHSVVCWRGLVLFLNKGALWVVFIEQKSDVSLPSLSAPTRITPIKARYIHTFHMKDRNDKSPSFSSPISLSDGGGGGPGMDVGEDVEDVTWLVMTVGDNEPECIEMSIINRPLNVASHHPPAASITWHQAYTQQCRHHISNLQRAFSTRQGTSDNTGDVDVVLSIRDALSEASASFEAERSLRSKSDDVDSEIIQVAALVKMLQKNIWPSCLHICVHFDHSISITLDTHSASESNMFTATLSMFTSLDICVRALHGRDVIISWREECHIPAYALGMPPRVVSSSTARIHFTPYSQTSCSPHPKCPRAGGWADSDGFICQISLSLPINKPVPHSLELFLHLSTLHPETLQSSIADGIREHFGTSQHMPDDLMGSKGSTSMSTSDTSTETITLPWGLITVPCIDILTAVKGTHVAAIGSETKAPTPTLAAVAASTSTSHLPTPPLISPTPHGTHMDTQEIRNRMVCEYLSQTCPPSLPPCKYSLSCSVPVLKKEGATSSATEDHAAIPWTAVGERMEEILRAAEVSTGGGSGVGLAHEHRTITKLQALASSSTHRLISDSINGRAAIVTSKASKIKLQESCHPSTSNRSVGGSEKVSGKAPNSELTVLNLKSNSRLLLCLLQSELRNEVITTASKLDAAAKCIDPTCTSAAAATLPVSIDGGTGRLTLTDRDVYSLPMKLQQVLPNAPLPVIYYIYMDQIIC